MMGGSDAELVLGFGLVLRPVLGLRPGLRFRFGFGQDLHQAYTVMGDSGDSSEFGCGVGVMVMVRVRDRG